MDKIVPGNIDKIVLISLVNHPCEFYPIYISGVIPVLNVTAKEWSESVFWEVIGLESLQHHRCSFRYSLPHQICMVEKGYSNIYRLKTQGKRNVEVWGNGKYISEAIREAAGGGKDFTSSSHRPDKLWYLLLSSLFMLHSYNI